MSFEGDQLTRSLLSPLGVRYREVGLSPLEDDLFEQIYSCLIEGRCAFLFKRSAYVIWLSAFSRKPLVSYEVFLHIGEECVCRGLVVLGFGCRQANFDCWDS